MGRQPTGAAMGKGSSGGAIAFRFTAREVAEMEKALESSKGSTPPRAVVLGLAEIFSTSGERLGQKPIQWKQVWNWFQNRRHSQKAKIARSPENLKAVSVTPDAQPKKVPAPSGAVPSGTGKSRNDSQQMEFEAKSARDGAWYDVSTFISHRLASSGDPEVRVRFAGFGSEEDEWVNVRSAVRQRSLPCEASECVAVLPGDLILCFQEGNEQALYFDADILDVQRRRHDVRGCRCRFWVRYRHDQSEEVVPLRKVCRRPETEYRLVKLQSYGKNPVIPAGGSEEVTKPDPPLNVPGGEVAMDAVSLAGAKVSEAVVQMNVPATACVKVLTPTTVTGFEMEENPSVVQSAAELATNNASEAFDTNPRVNQVVEHFSETKQASSVVEGLAAEQQTRLSGLQSPSLLAPPERYDAELESIVVLDRSDLEGISRT